MHLITPNAEYEASYREYIEELGVEERYPFPLDFDHSNFSILLTKLDNFRMGVDLPAGFVPSTTYWLVDGGEIVGVSNLRHFLNDRIRYAGGHIGLGIKPSKRGKGLSNLLLKLTIAKAVELGIHPIHIHCHKENIASARMIMSNGGKLESEIEEAGEVVQRYLVNTV